MPLPRADVSIPRVSAKEMVYDTIREWIISRQLAPGEKVSDKEMAERFNVSRTPVREALMLLESQKLIKSYPGKATIVTEIDTDGIEKWYLPMSTLQQLGVSLAVDKIQPSQIRELSELADIFKESVKTQDQPIHIIKSDYAFHKYILDIAGNEYIADFCDILWPHIQRLEYTFFRDVPMEESIAEHENIIRALTLKDEYSASIVMKSHWERTVHMLRQLISVGSFYK